MIHTIEDNFDYQVKEAVDTMREELIEEESEMSLPDYIWDNKERFGELIYTQAGEHLGYDIFDK